MATDHTVRVVYSLTSVLALVLLMVVCAIAPTTAQGRQLKAARGPCEECVKKNVTIQRLRNDVDNLSRKVRRLEKELDQSRADKAKLQTEVARLKAPPASPVQAPPEPARKRQVALAGMAKMNAQQARSTAGCHLSGKVAIIAVDPLPNRPGQHRVTIVDPAALAPGGQSTTRPSSGGAIVQGNYVFAVPPAFALTFHPGATMHIVGDVEGVEALPAGKHTPAEIRLSLTNVQAGP